MGKLYVLRNINVRLMGVPKHGRQDQDHVPDFGREGELATFGRGST